MGIAIGPMLAASSIFQAAFLRGAAVKDADYLFALRGVRSSRDKSNQGRRGVSYPDYQDVQAALPRASWRYMTAWKIRDVNRTTARGDLPLRIAAIAGDYFRLANARFVQGAWPPEEDGVVVTRALWRELLNDGGRAELTIYNQQYRVVGVTDDSFRGLYPTEGIDAWVPLSALPRLEASLNMLSFRELDDLSVFVQSGSDAGARALQSSVSAISPRLAEFHNGHRDGWRLELVHAQPTFLELLRTPRGQLALAPLLVMLCVLLIAATNVANLFVVRAVARERELQLRLALGIRRGRLVLHECLEPIVLGLAGLAVGLGLGLLVLNQLTARPTFKQLGLQLSTVSVLSACAAALVFAGMCVVMPAVRLSGLREAHVVHQGQGITAHGVSRVQRGYLVVQFTLALAFTCVAVQLASAVRQQAAVHVGFDTQNLLVVTGTIGSPGRTPAQWLTDYNRIVSAVSSVRGVVSVSASVSEFFGGYSMSRRPISVIPTTDLSSDRPLVAALDVVGPGYFETLGLGMRGGRDFGADDRPGMPASILVNQTLAKLIAGSGQPVGMTLYELGTYPLQIIGVVPDIRTTAAEQVQPVYYRSLGQSPLPSFVLYARVAAYTPSHMSAIVSAIMKESPESAGRLRIRTAEDQRRQRDFPALAVFWLSTGLAAIAMLITGLGLYGVASYATLSRTKEHAIRAALGASPRRLAAAVVSEGLSWTGMAAALGLPFVWISTRVATALVVGLRPTPVLTSIALVTSYLVVMVFAMMLPARRASSVSPSNVLRSF